jgi:hypothetical protein
VFSIILFLYGFFPMKNIYETTATVDNLPRTVSDIKYVNVMELQYFFFLLNVTLQTC